ncbi:HNH endonuclease signature motif containing protein [Nocardioides cynanchi]|uniref:HNH endonuclease signature motif containing protein n=1 Tax=Nocardioides cynanchi TaxID=2558918 RepID=UPI00124410BA|nr:HNH endonuclease signature motif containing protein [Nocardioides cynanchi]
MNSGLAVTSPTAELHACLDRLATIEPSRLGDEEQARLLLELSRAESRLAGLRLALLAVAEKAQTARRAGAASTGQWAARLVHADGGDTQRQVGLATGLDGHAPTRRALSEGKISPAHAEVIVRADRQLPATVSPEQRSAVERSLLTRAETLSPSSLRRVARRALSAIEPDRAVVDAHEDAILRDEEAEARARTRLSLHDDHDGTVSGRFTVPTLQGHLLRKILETVTAPRRGRLGSLLAQSGAAHGVHTDWDHARGTAFCELLEHLPTDHLHPRTAATVVVTLDDATLRGAVAAAGLDTGDSISSGEARRLACNAGVMPAVLGGRSEVLDLGRLKRLFSPSQRIALGLRFKTCAADGCERPFAWCELHHRRPWSRQGPTDLADAVPLCHFHHQRIHDTGFVHASLPDGSVRFSRRR